MYLETRKIHLIEEVLKANDESILIEIESVFNKFNSKLENKKDIYDFVGVISKSDANEMIKAIADTCENIDSNDWK